MVYFYYTKWKFKPNHKPEDLGYGEVFHSTWETSSPSEEFLSRTSMNCLSEFFIKQFNSKEEMNAYWLNVNR